jgi:EmrB/QacA subfamily drug resistance transporter
MSSLSRTHAAQRAASPGPQRGATFGIAIVLLAQLVITLDSTIVNVALPDIATDLSFGPAALSWVLNGYILAFGGLLLLGGRLGDVLGRRRMFSVGLAIFTVFSLLSGLAPTAGLLVAFRVLQGLGGALAAPQVLALLTASAPDEAARNRAIGLFASVSAGAGTLGYVLGGLLTDFASWRWTLFINVPLGVVSVVLAGRFIVETPREEGRFDVVGAISATGGAVALVWALTTAPAHGWDSVRTIGGLVAGGTLLLVFGLTEHRTSHPLLRLGLLRSHLRVASLISIFAFVGSQIAMYFVLVQYLAIELGFSPLQTGLAFVPLTVGVMVVAQLVTKLIARISPPYLVLVGALLTVGSFIWLSRIDSESTFLGYVLGPMLVSGITTALIFGPSVGGTLAGVEPEHAGTASGLLQTMQQLGGAVGLAVIASVYTANAVPGQFLPGVHQAFIAAAVLAGIAGLSALTLILRRTPR